MRFHGTESYVATEDLKVAVNAAIVLERPLLVKGEPGTGKTVLAEEIAAALGAPLITWHVKSTTRPRRGSTNTTRSRACATASSAIPRVSEIRNYIRKGKLWEAFDSDKRPVLLIDEIDKADIEFPNDLLLELDRMEFHVYETGETIRAEKRPIVIITSNNEKELPDAFLRRCFFHYIRFPDAETMEKIVDVHFPGIKKRLVAEAHADFLRRARGARPQEEALDLRAAGLAEAAAIRGYGPRNPARARPQEAHPPAARRPAQERAGRASVRADCVHEPAGRTVKPCAA